MISNRRKKSKLILSQYSKIKRNILNHEFIRFFRGLKQKKLNLLNSLNYNFKSVLRFCY